MEKTVKITIIENELYFTMENNKYKIPSKLYPLSRKTKISIFSDRNTENFLDMSAICEELDNLYFNAGLCYTNTDKVCRTLTNKVEYIQFYSGWVFAGANPPKHHAWAVVQIGGQIGIIDSYKYNLLQKIIFDYGEHIHQNDWKEKIAQKIVEYDKQMKNHEKIIIGKCPSHFLYVGTPDTLKNARRVYNLLVKKFDKHPSYAKNSPSVIREM